MTKDILFKIKYTLSQITFNRKKEINKRIKESFGNIKDDSFDFDMIEKYFRNKDNSGAFQVLSDKTCNDLDFDDLYMFIDRTNSKVGQQYLYNKLRTIKADKQQTKLDEEIIEKQEEVSHLMKVINSLNDHDKELIVMNRIDGIKYEQIAEIVGSNTIAVKTKIHRIVKKLRTNYFETLA